MSHIEHEQRFFRDIPLSLYIEPPDALDGNVLPGWPGRALLCKHRRRGSKYSATEQLTTALSSLHQSASKCTAAAQSWYAFPLHLAVNWLPPTPPTAQQPQSTGKFPALSLVPDLSPEMMTHSLGPQVCTFPMVSPVHRSLKWGKPLPTSKTASPVGASVTARAFGLAVEECGMTSEVGGGGGDQLHLGLATGRHSTDSASQKRATHEVYFLLSSLLPP